jgi:hypothetical protein
MRTTKGCLILRGKLYHAVWYYGNKRFAVSTKTGNRKEALAKMQDLVAPFTAATDTAVQEALVGRMNGRKSAAERLLDERAPALRIVDTWRAFMESPARPDSGKGTLAWYETHWGNFREWIGRVHPDCEHLRDVTPDMAAAYARELAGARLSASTYNQRRNLLRMVWRVLADEGRLT